MRKGTSISFKDIPSKDRLPLAYALCKDWGLDAYEGLALFCSGGEYFEAVEWFTYWAKQMMKEEE